MHWTAGGWACEWHSVRATAISQTRRSVTIRVTAEYRPMQPDEACAAVVAEGTKTVTLRRRLGSRRLIHARTDRLP